MKRRGPQLRAWLILGRVSNLPTIWTNVMAAWVLGGGALAWQEAALAWLLLGASLLYLGGTTLNDFFDVVFDRQYRRERPIPSGLLQRSTVGLVGIVYLVAGALAILLGAQGSWIYLGCLIAAIILYDYRHKQWAGSVFVMGACRFFLSLLAASCAVSGVTLPVIAHALGLLVYIVALSLTARGESREAENTGRHAFLLLLPPLGALWVGLTGAPSNAWVVILTVMLFTGVIAASVSKLTRRSDAARIGESVALMLAGIAMLDAAFLASYGWLPAMLGLGGFMLALALQRFVPAT